ncbi:hypothetical protein D3C76_1214480 [compost metagenome]
MNQLHGQALVINLAGKLEQMGFQPKDLAILMKGRLNSNVHHAGVGLPFMGNPYRVYPAGRHDIMLRKLEVSRWKPELAPAFFTVHDRPLQRVRPSEPAIGQLDLAFLQRFTDSRAADLLSVDQERRHRVHVQNVTAQPRCAP